ncbi:MAG: hypothetical protein KGN74_14190 [Gemmatimonadota bacterium]|nr:hypothetical protein [Gemmatimonadota bacterium]MDE3174216.1 hypothetical protein [Gemmatimonadota bacterium]
MRPSYRPHPTRTVAALSLLAAAAVSACSSGGSPSPTTPTTPPSGSFTLNPCSVADTLRLTAAQVSRVDCSNGGTTVTLAGNGASYLVLAEFPTDQAGSTAISYQLAAVTAAAKSVAPAASLAAPIDFGTGTLPPIRPNRRQMAFDAALRATGARMAAAGDFARTSARAAALRNVAASTTPAVGSVRTFHVRSTFSASNPTWKAVGAKLRYAGANVLLYIDTMAPAPPDGFTDTQVQQFASYFDQTLYPIDTAAFGQPSDVDQNGHVIMLMSPVVNADTPKQQCQTQGYVLGFFDPVDFDGPSDPNSNQGEIFYSIVPDSLATVSCSHPAGDVMFAAPGTFLHELQHLIDFSQHVIVRGGNPQPGWLDEGLSIAAEELGSLYYERKCPPPSCRTSAGQIFPDSSQGFIQGFLYDSYQYALKPDTASLTTHSDADGGFSWRGGDWALVRWLGDQFGDTVFRRMEQTPATGVASIESATGQSFPSLFSDFGLALYTDSLPGLPRNTAPAADRFATRNLEQLWARLYATSGPSSDIPLATPLRLTAITSDTTPARLYPGTPAFYRLDTPQNAAGVTLLFAAPGARPLSSALHPQLAIFRLPPGQ